MPRLAVTAITRAALHDRTAFKRRLNEEERRGEEKRNGWGKGASVSIKDLHASFGAITELLKMFVRGAARRPAGDG